MGVSPYNLHVFLILLRIYIDAEAAYFLVYKNSGSVMSNGIFYVIEFSGHAARMDKYWRILR
jgi:hypothetical protein